MFQFIDEIKQLQLTKSISRQEAADKMAKIQLPKLLSFISQHTVSFLVICLWGLSTAVTFKVGTELLKLPSILQFAGLSLLPFLFVSLFIIIGGFFAQIGKVGIIEGKFPRSASHPIYALRRIYGAAWTQVYYFKPLYAICLAVPLFKKMLFRSYGYKGPMDFIVYPDSWIRDLPIINLGKNVYLANRCVLGTNLCLGDGSIVVEKCTIGDNVIVGHLGIFGLGAKLGNKSEIGISASTGIRVRTGENVMIAAKAIVYHAVILGDNVKIGGCAVIGMKSVIKNGIEIKGGAIIEPGTEIQTQEQADKLFNREKENLEKLKEDLFSTLREHNINGSVA